MKHFQQTPRCRYSLFALTFLVAILVVAATASTPQQEKAQNNPADSQTGLELWWGGSFILSDTDFPLTVKPEYLNYPIGDQAAKGGGYSGKFTNSFGIGARVFPVFSFGLFGFFPSYEAKDIAGSEDITRSSWSAGIMARIYPSVFINEINPFLDFFVAGGAGYLFDKQDYEISGKTDAVSYSAEVSMEAHSAICPFQIGVGYRLHERVTVGARLDYLLVVPVGYEAEFFGEWSPFLSGNPFVPNELTVADPYGILAIGAEIRTTLF